MKTKKLSLKKDDAPQLVVDEEVGDLGPHHASEVAVMHHGVKNLLQDSVEEPLDDGGIDGHPITISTHGQEINSAVDVVAETIPAEEKTELRLPCVKIGLGVGEFHRDMIKDQKIPDASG